MADSGSNEIKTEAAEKTEAYDGNESTEAAESNETEATEVETANDGNESTAESNETEAVRLLLAWAISEWQTFVFLAMDNKQSTVSTAMPWLVVKYPRLGRSKMFEKTFPAAFESCRQIYDDEAVFGYWLKVPEVPDVLESGPEPAGVIKI